MSSRADTSGEAHTGTEERKARHGGGLVLRRADVLMIAAFSAIGIGLWMGVRSLLRPGPLTTPMLTIFVSVLLVVLGIAFYTHARLEGFLEKRKPTVQSNSGEVSKHPVSLLQGQVRQILGGPETVIRPAFPAREFLELMEELETQRRIEPKDFLLLVQSVLIAMLLAWLSQEYNANVGMREWIALSFPAGAILLNAQFVSGLIGSIIAVTVFFIFHTIRTRRKLQQIQARFG